MQLSKESDAANKGCLADLDFMGVLFLYYLNVMEVGVMKRKG